MKLSKLAAAIACCSTGLLGTLSLPVIAEDTVEEVIVTGTAKARTTFDTPLTASSLNSEQLERVSFSSQADILMSVPGVKAEGGGGEVATNLFTRGLPSGGQFEFTPLQYDGIPTISTFGLNSSAHDIYYRNDLGLERLEFVRAGVSNLFGAGSVSGLINYITKTGGDEHESTIQLEVAEEGRFKADFAANGPLGAGTNNYYALSGWYRFDEGPYDTGFDAEGFQLRGNFKHVFDDDSGSFTIYGQAIDDVTVFYLPLNLDGQSRKPINGIQQVLTPEFKNQTFPTPEGSYTSPIDDQISAIGYSVAFALNKDLGNDWTANIKASVKDYDHNFQLSPLVDAVPRSQQEFLDNFGATSGLGATLADASFTFTQTGQPVPSDVLIQQHLMVDRIRSLEDATFEANLSKIIEAGGVEHAITVGGYFARGMTTHYNVEWTDLGEFASRGQLIDLSVNGTVYSRDGFAGYRGYTNRDVTARRSAFYIADQIESGRWIIDIGARWEEIDVDNVSENKAKFNLDASDFPTDVFATLGPNLTSDITWGDDSFNTLSASEDALAVAGAVLFRLTDTVNLFANVSDGFFFPQPRNLARDAITKKVRKYESEDILQAEIGAKFAGERLSGEASIYYIELENRQSFDPQIISGVLTEFVNTISTETTGFELNGKYEITDTWSATLGVSYEDPEFTKHSKSPALIGNQFKRKPNELINFGISYVSDTFDFAVTDQYTGKAFADDTENPLSELEDFHTVRLDAGYTIDFADDSRLRLSVNVWNLLDEEALSEGNPRGMSSAGDFFQGRPILPRRVSLRANYKF